MSYRVRGRVRRSDNGAGISGLVVRAYDVDWISSNDYLGRDTTDSGGNFEITFERSAFDAGWFDPEGGPDLIVKIYNASNRLIYQSPERGGAGSDTYFDIRLNPLDLIGEYTVRGRVRDARSLRGLCNLNVVAYDDDFIFDDLLGSNRTDCNGNYQIPYERSDFGGGWLEGNPDPYVKVRNNDGRDLAVSFTRNEAPRHSTIDVNVGGQEIDRSVSECIYGWSARYRQEGTHVIVRIRLNPDSGVTATEMATLRTRWKTGIETKWSNRFACRCTGTSCTGQAPLTFEVLWVTSNQHHTVRVRRGPERSNMTTWDTNDTGDVASHEFGHMLGLVDEYADAACPGRAPINTGTVMDDNTEVVERQVEHLCRLLNEDAVPLAAAPEGGAASKSKAMLSAQKLAEKEKFAMCLRPDLEMRSELKNLVKSVVEGKKKLAKTDKIVHIVTGGIEGKRLSSELSISGTGEVSYRLDDQLKAAQGNYSTKIDQSVLKNLLADIKKSGLLDLKEAGGPFLPDSEIGIISIEINGKTTRFYYLTDPEQRRDQAGVTKQAVATIADNLNRLAQRTIKRDETIQKKIKDSIDKLKK